MKKESIMFGVIGLLVGVIIAGFAAGQAVNNNSSGMMKMMGISTNKTTATTSDTSTGHMGMSMDEMDNALKGKSGDDFDKIFISEMIDHHQGAIDMALLAQKNAKHDEVKKLAGDIISAQTNEIAEMQRWQQDWGYGTAQEASPDNMMNMSH